MKKIFITFIFAIISILFSSCNHFKEIKERNNFLADSLARVNFIRDSIAKADYSIVNMVDSALLIYPNAFNNDIQQDRFIKYCFMEVITNMKYISDIPLEFKMMQKYGNKYILKFEQPIGYSEDKKLKSNKTNIKIDFNIFCKVNENIAENLIVGNKYYLNGDFESNILKLNSGNIYNLNGASCYNGSLEKIITFEFVMKNVLITKID